MKTFNSILTLSVLSFLLIHCYSKTENNTVAQSDSTALKPVVVSQK